MTAPVSQSNGEKIAMTAPVTQSAGLNAEGNYAVSFVLPSTYTLETAPKPIDDRVSIRQVPAKTVAVLRYSGAWDQVKYRKHESILLEAIKQEGLEILSPPAFARYNPPFWPWFLKRNEILVEIQP